MCSCAPVPAPIPLNKGSWHTWIGKEAESISGC